MVAVVDRHSSKTGAPDIDWSRVAGTVLISRALDELEEAQLVPARKVLYQFTARGHDVTQAIFGQMLTGARDGAVASLRLKHVNVDLGHVFQDAREVNTKAAKTIHCQFFPVDATYRDCFAAYVTYLRDVKMFGPEDALFPKAQVGVVEGKGFANLGLSRTGFANASKLNTIIKTAFAAVQMPQYTPHAFRKTLTHLGNELCHGPEAFKAWSMNLGHENVATTINSYLPVTTERQMELIRNMGR